MRKILLLLFLTYGCAQVPPRGKVNTQNDDVSLVVALDQAQMSYLKGCVEAFKEMGQGPSFDRCRDRAVQHRKEIDFIHSQIEDLRK